VGKKGVFGKDVFAQTKEVRSWARNSNIEREERDEGAQESGPERGERGWKGGGRVRESKTRRD